LRYSTEACISSHTDIPGSASVVPSSTRVTCAPSTDFVAKCPNCTVAVWSSYWSGISRLMRANLCTTLIMLSPPRLPSSSALLPRFMAGALSQHLDDQ
jgi:hypothetical protein